MRVDNAQGGFQTWLYTFYQAIWLDVSPGFYWFEYQQAHPEAETWQGYLEPFLERWQ